MFYKHKQKKLRGLLAAGGANTRATSRRGEYWRRGAPGNFRRGEHRQCEAPSFLRKKSVINLMLVRAVLYLGIESSLFNPKLLAHMEHLKEHEGRFVSKRALLLHKPGGARMPKRRFRGCNRGGILVLKLELAFFLYRSRIAFLAPRPHNVLICT